MNGRATRQRWTKLGRLVDAAGMPITMALTPTVHRLHRRIVRLYYGALDERDVARIEFVDVDLAEPTSALTSSALAMDIGAPGTFDDNGTLPACVFATKRRLFLLYVGFQLRSDMPYSMLAGLASSSDGGSTFVRAQVTPLLPATPEERAVRGAGFLMRLGPRYGLWYLAGSRWLAAGGRMLPTYELRFASSSDLWNWPATGEICYAPEGAEIGFGRPWIIRTDAGFRLWQGVRSRAGYKQIGWATSTDGRDWRRMGPIDLGPPIPDLDDQEVCHPAIVVDGDRAIMFYNGNGRGRAGIGVAMAQTSDVVPQSTRRLRGALSPQPAPP